MGCMLWLCGFGFKSPVVLGIAESLEAKSKKCKAFLIWHIKLLIIILWALHR